MAQEILAQRLWTAAQNDADLRARLRSSYGGRLDVFDALWWRANPLSPTPAGLPDPGVELIDLKAAVYRLHTDPEPLEEFVDPITQHTVFATETEHRLRTRMREQAQEDAALDAVLALVENGSDTTASGATRSDSAGAGPGESPYPVDPGADDPLRKHRVAVLLVLAGAVVGALIALAVPALVDPAGLPVAGNPAATETVAPTDPDADDRRRTGRDVLKIFDEPAEFADGQVPDLGISFDQDSIRSIGPAPGDTGYDVYVAKRGQSQYCIVVQDADNTGTNACASPDTLARTGLWAHATVLGTIPIRGNPRLPVLLSLYVIWAPDGTITTISHPYVDKCGVAPANC